MQSRAHFRGHPIHPMLVAFPIAFLTGAFLFDVASILWDNPGYWSTGTHLVVAGLLTAVVAAVPGLIDYYYTVPPNSSAMERATRHLQVNLFVLVAFGIGLVLRLTAGEGSAAFVAGVELMGVLALVWSGWMGGILVHRNQIGVNPRYARAGRWKEETFAVEPGEALKVADAGELEVDQMKLMHVNGDRIVLARTETGYVAFDDRCTHKGGSLAGGMMICGTVQCPWHGTQFDVQTGAVKAGPAEHRIKTYPIEHIGSDIMLKHPG